MIKDFYDQLSDLYHLVFAEGFDVSIQRHAEIINRVIRETWGDGPESIIDASCGIGTQAIGLTNLGYSVSASDLSPNAIARAKREAKYRNVNIQFQVSDMRNLNDVHLKTADVVIAIDASIQHLLSDDSILSAFQQFYKLVSPGGGCIISAHDYKREKIQTGTIRPYKIKEVNGIKHIIFQVWDCSSAIYNLSMYFVKDRANAGCETSVLRTQFNPITISRLMELLEQIGFADIQRIDDIFYQPVIIGKKF